VGWFARTGVTGTDRHDDLTNVDTGDSAVGLAPGTTHTSLKSIGTGTRQHLVDTDDVEWVGADTEVESFLSSDLNKVLVGADTSGLEGLGTQLLILVGDEVDAEREVVDGSALAAKIVDANLGIGDTTVEPGLGVGLRVIKLAKLFVSHIMILCWWMDMFDGELRISAGLSRLATRQPPQCRSVPTEIHHRQVSGGSSKVSSVFPCIGRRQGIAGAWFSSVSLSLSYFFLLVILSMLSALSSRNYPSLLNLQRSQSRRSPCSCSNGSNERDDGPS
jgi:hypothetical protein